MAEILSLWDNELTGSIPSDLTSSGHMSKKINGYLNVYSSSGQLMVISTSTEVDMTALPSGIYSLMIHTENGVFTEKVMKK